MIWMGIYPSKFAFLRNLCYNIYRKWVNFMKLWVDDLRQPPSDEWLWAVSVDQSKLAIKVYEKNMHDDTILIDLDHDAGDYAKFGGDFIRLLDWLEQEGIVDTGYFFCLHTMNPVGRENMRRIIQKNGWREIK